MCVFFVLINKNENFEKKKLVKPKGFYPSSFSTTNSNREFIDDQIRTKTKQKISIVKTFTKFINKTDS